MIEFISKELLPYYPAGVSPSTPAGIKKTWRKTWRNKMKIHTTQSLPNSFRVIDPIQKKNLNFGTITNLFDKDKDIFEFDDFNDLVKIIENGYIFTTCIFDGKKSDDNIIENDLFCMDFDCGVKICDIEKRLKRMCLDYNFSYYSISNSDKQEKFRLIFKLCKTVLKEDIEKYKNTIEVFIKFCFYDSKMKNKNILDIKSYSPSNFWLGSNKNSVKRINNSALFDYYNVDFFITNYFIEEFGNNYKRNIKNIFDNLIIQDKKLSDKINNSFISNGVLKDIADSYLLTRAVRVFSQNHTSDSKNPNKNDTFSKKSLKINKEKKKLLNCSLSADFIKNLRKLTHFELYHLANNFYQISGGEKYFMDILRDSSKYSINKINDMESHFKYLRKNRYQGPTYCSKNCPYFDVCPKNNKIKPEDHNILHFLDIGKGQTKLKNVNITLKENKKTLLSIREDLNNELNKINLIDNSDNYVIKAPCGSGKSHWNKMTVLDDVLVVVPTLAILDEYRETYNSVSKAPKLDFIFENKIKRINNNNLSGVIKVYNEARAIYMKKGNIELADKITSFLEDLYHVHEGSKVVTTHASYFNNMEKYNHSTIIIDEDPINEILKIKTITLSDITKVMNKIKSDHRLYEKYKNVYLILQKIKNVKENKISNFPVLNNVYSKIWDDCFKELSYLYNSPLIALKNHKFYIKSDNGSIIFCEDKIELPKDKKVIIQSATINEEMAKLLYGADVNFIDLGTPEMVGRLYQDGEISYSRESLNRSLSQDIKIINKINNIKEKNIDYIISFLGNKEDFDDGDIEFLNFGASSGINHFTGLDGLVIGTPYPNPNNIKLIASSLQNKKINKSEIKFETILRGNTEGKVNLYTNDIMRIVQINFIETELIQSIGRSRLYEYDCNVYVLSSFPISGSKVETF